MFEQAFKNIDADLRNEAGCTAELDYNKAQPNLSTSDLTTLQERSFYGKEIFAIDNYAFDGEAILLAGNNAVGDFNVKHYKGKFNAYQRAYVITVTDENRLS